MNDSPRRPVKRQRYFRSTRKIGAAVESANRPSGLSKIPVTLAFIAILGLAEISSLTLSLTGFSVNEHFVCSYDALISGHVWTILTFLFTSTAPIDAASSDPKAIVVTGFAIFVLISCCIAVAGSQVEGRVGSIRTLAIIAFSAAMHLVFSITLNVRSQDPALAFSAIAPALALSFLMFARTRKSHESCQAEIHLDVLLMLLTFLMLFVIVSAAFELLYASLFSGVVAGCMTGCFALALWRDHWEGPRKVEVAYELLSLDLMEVLPLSEVRSRVDSLLERVSSEGYESLSDEERDQLERASQRLRRERSVSGADEVS